MDNKTERICVVLSKQEKRNLIDLLRLRGEKYAVIIRGLIRDACHSFGIIQVGPQILRDAGESIDNKISKSKRNG